MKKSLVSALLALLLLFALAACGAPAPAPEPTPEPTAVLPVPSLSSVLPGSDLQSPSGGESVETASPAAPAVDEALLEAVRACIDQDVSVLYDTVGKPLDSSYAPSCLGIEQNGEDGELYYEGFTVATYREGDKEIVRDVIVDVG